MKKLSIRTLATSTSFLAALIMTPVIGAQAALQNTSSGLQQQSSKTQSTANTQQQSGTLQNNNSGEMLNQSSARPLGVVSSPDQTEPDAIVQPSPTLTTTVSDKKESSDTRTYVVLGSIAIVITGIYALRRTTTPKPVAEPVSTPVIRPEPIKLPKKKRKSRTKKKSKK